MIFDEINKIDGWLTLKEIKFLYKIASKCKGKGVIVEVGSYKGKSTITIAKAIKENKIKTKIYAIDPHFEINQNGKSSKHEFLENIKRFDVDDVIIPIFKTSEQAYPDITEPIEMIFIDGDHSYNVVKKDFDLWVKKLINNGIIAMHDTIMFYDGPCKVAENNIYKSRYFKNVKLVDSITKGIKVEKNTFLDVVSNRIKLVYKKFIHFGWKISHKLRIPKSIRTLISRIIQ